MNLTDSIKIKVAIYIFLLIASVYVGVFSVVQFADKRANDFLSSEIAYHQSKSNSGFDDPLSPEFEMLLNASHQLYLESFQEKFLSNIIIISIMFFFCALLYRNSRLFEVGYFYFPILLVYIFFPINLMCILPIIFWVLGFFIRWLINKWVR
ncbi:hypothetical protein ACVBE9_02625 [Eionea flava]